MNDKEKNNKHRIKQMILDTGSYNHQDVIRGCYLEDKTVVIVV